MALCQIKVIALLFTDLTSQHGYGRQAGQNRALKQCKNNGDLTPASAKNKIVTIEEETSGERIRAQRDFPLF